MRLALACAVLLGLLDLALAANNTTGSGNTTRSASAPTPAPVPPLQPVQLCSYNEPDGPCLVNERAMLARFVSFAEQGNNAASFIAKSRAVKELNLWCNDKANETACKAAGKHCTWVKSSWDATYSYCTLEASIQQELNAGFASDVYCPGTMGIRAYTCSAQSDGYDNITQAQARCKEHAQDGCVWAVKGGTGQCTTSDLAPLSDKDFAAYNKMLMDDRYRAVWAPQMYGCCATYIQNVLYNQCAGSTSKSACTKMKHCVWYEAGFWSEEGDSCTMSLQEVYRAMLPKAMGDLLAKDAATCTAATLPKEKETFWNKLFGALLGSSGPEADKAALAKRKAACEAPTLSPAELKPVDMDKALAVVRTSPKPPDVKTCPKSFAPIW